MRLPPGFRFEPTEQELVFQYLRSKVFSCPLPTSVIPELNVFNFDPWDLPTGASGPSRYYFSNIKETKDENGDRMRRATVSGYWKTSGSDKEITSSKWGHVTGLKKTLVFYVGRPPNGSRTDWIMHEYHLVGSVTNNSNQTSSVEEGWIICCVFRKERKERWSNREVTTDRDIVSMAEDQVNLSPTSSSSSSSGIRQMAPISSNESDHEESGGCSTYSSCCRRN